ncbi:hypothetical protein EHW64_13625 [Erwinia psidii]|uniref:hypothetical protein n=1 Tax=Erwinia psidii TaxID=69224 RepID=UPI00226B560A|nr:hypothetical protein [Erwinia psidii]MCX8962142.1 hypothetical protein [Erwinia psidii]
MDRNTWNKDGELIPVPVAAGAEIFGGHIVGIDSDGFAVPAGKDVFQTLGISDGWVDNSSGDDGDEVVLVRRKKVFCLANSVTSPVQQNDLGGKCYAQDSVTVSHENTGNALAVAGVVLSLENDNVWVEI